MIFQNGTETATGNDWGSGPAQGVHYQATIEAAEGDYIVAIIGNSGDTVDSIGFVTKSGQQFGPWGGGGGQGYRLDATPPGTEIIGFFGGYGKNTNSGDQVTIKQIGGWCRTRS